MSMNRLPSQMMINQQFMQQQHQPGQHQPSLNQMGLMQNVNGANPPMGILSVGHNNTNMLVGQRFDQQMQANMQQNGQRRPSQPMLPQGQNAQLLSSSVPGPGPHITGLSNNLQMGFPSNPMHPGNNAQLRRTTSQPSHLGGLQQGMSINPHLMQTQIRAPQQQPIRMAHPGQESMSPMINRGMPQNSTRTTPAQLMNSLNQPILSQSLSGGRGDNFQNPIPVQHQLQQGQVSSSPRPGSLSQSQTPSSMTMAAQGVSQPSGSRSQLTHDNSVSMNYQNNQFAQHNANRIAANFPFVPSSTPPTQHGDLSQPMSMGMSNPSAPSNRPPFPLMGEYGNFVAASLQPPRPPSHNSHNNPSIPLIQQQQQQQLHHSPRQSEPLAPVTHPHRPQSQPQQPGRPPSQSGRSQTPRGSQLQPPSNSQVMRQPSLPQQGQLPPQPPGPGQSIPIGPAPAQNGAPGQPTASAPPSISPDAANPNANTRPPPVVTLIGQGLTRLLQFSGILSNENHNKLQLSFWNDFIADYFTPRAMMKFTLWKDNQKTEAKPFEIGVPILPRFFLVTTQSGVKSMTLSLDGARERLQNPGHVVVECVDAVWTYKYTNGYTVTLRGPLTARIIICATQAGANTSGLTHPYSLKFDNLQFDANFHDKFIALEAIMGQRVMEPPNTPHIRNTSNPMSSGSVAQQREEDKRWEEPRITIERASIPGEPVNAFGIPQATMRCLELAESVGQMGDLISFSTEKNLGPLDALSKFANMLRESQPPQSSLNGAGGSNPGATAYPPFQNTNGVPATPPVALYSNSNPPNIMNPQPPPNMNSPINPSMSTENSPQKSVNQQTQSGNTAPQPAQGPVSTPAPSSSSHNTPSLTSASLKRKQTETSNSPTTSNVVEQAPKRSTRKRGRTAG